MRLLLFLFALLVPLPLRADGIRVDGCAVSPEHRPVAGAQAELRPILNHHETTMREWEGKDRPEPVALAVSGEDGCFLLRAPKPGMWSVTLRAQGRVPMQYDLLPLLEESSLPLVELQPALGVRVRVEDPEGKPLPKAWMRMERAWPQHRTGWSPAERTGFTGQDGGLSLSRAPQESFRVSAIALGHLPGRSGQTRGGTLTLRLARGLPRTLELTGQEDGKPLAGAVLWEAASGLAVGRTGEDGRIPVALSPTGAPVEFVVFAPDHRTAAVRLVSKAGGPDRISIAVPRPEPVLGRVREGRTRRALAGALVWPEYDPGSFAVANARGRFRLPWTPGSRAPIVAAAPGYSPSSREPASPAAPLRIALEPAPRLAGLVVDGEGRPVLDAEIRALPVTDDRYGEPRTESYRARSDASGRFRMALPPGSYHLSGFRFGFAPSFSGVTLEATAGGQEPRLVLLRGRSALGAVVDPEGRPVPGARVELTRKRPYGDDSVNGLPGYQALYQAHTSPEGRFTLHDLPADWFDLRIEHASHATLIRSAILLEESDTPAELGTFTLEAGRTITGVVVDPEGRPLAGTEVWLREGPSRSFATTPHLRRQHRPRQVTGPDGWFAIPHVEKEADLLQACRKGYDGIRIHVSGEQGEEPLRLVLEPHRRLSGRVIDDTGRPVPNAFVYAHLDGSVSTCIIDFGDPCPESSSFPDSWTDSEGRFVLEPIRSGRATLQARTEGLREAEPQIVEILEDREPGPVELVFQPMPPPDPEDDAEEERSQPHGVRGRIVGPWGEPIQGAWVRIGSSQLFTGPDGSFAAVLTDPEVKLSVWKQGYAPLERRLWLPAADIEVQLHEPAVVTGRMLGLPPELLSDVLLYVVEPGAPRTHYDADGSYRIADLGPGEWEIHAAVAGRVATGRVTLLPGQREAVLDLVFPEEEHEEEPFP